MPKISTSLFSCNFSSCKRGDERKGARIYAETTHNKKITLKIIFLLRRIDIETELRFVTSYLTDQFFIHPSINVYKLWREMIRKRDWRRKAIREYPSSSQLLSQSYLKHLLSYMVVSLIARQLRVHRCRVGDKDAKFVFFYLLQ